MEHKPNIVLIVADNLGWGELGCYGGGALRGAPTPNIDRLAAEGLLLQNFNVESDCVPTRSALMSGRHPIRTGCLQSVPPGLPQHGFVQQPGAPTRLVAPPDGADALVLSAVNDLGLAVGCVVDDDGLHAISWRG